MSFGISIGDCIAITKVILAAYKCWSNTSTELEDFMAMVSDLKTRIEALAENRAFEPQILRPPEWKFLCDWSLATFSILSDFQRIHHNEEHQFIQRLRWLCTSKLKSLSKKISGQLQSLNDFEQKLMLRSVTESLAANRAMIFEGKIACSPDQEGLLGDVEITYRHNMVGGNNEASD